MRLICMAHWVGLWADRLTEFVYAVEAGVVLAHDPAWQRQERDNVSCAGYPSRRCHIFSQQPSGRGRGS